MGDPRRVAIVLPPHGGVGTGNLRTAERWLALLNGLGVPARLAEGEELASGDTLVALNAVKSHRIITDFRRRFPHGKLVLAVTGTDLNRRDSREWQESVAAADALVVLQEKALQALTPAEQEKAHLILQSVACRADFAPRTRDGFFQVAVVGHLRAEKDPLLAARAVRRLPDCSRVRLLQAGAILEEKYRAAVAREEKENPRYQWLGELAHGEALELIARSELMVLTSTSEGGPGVIGEAVTLDTPVLSSAIDGVVGLLGEDFPGYFAPGDAGALAGLLSRVEKEQVFYQELQAAGRARRALFAPERERAAWARLLAQL
ncbi:selenoneine biosynthesis selenosugar synthase SenB [Roseibacillus ishigakijimensis]|nr:selenoneine biosynthesis selenosugar synthase SenB [Roseibacillus ishigakijimensis]